MHRVKNIATVLAPLLLIPLGALAKERYEGTAVIRASDAEYTIPIECRNPARPELGFNTEASRITKEKTGRSSMVNLRVQPWKDTGDVIVSLSGYVAWIPTPPSAGGVMSVRLDMSPVSVARNNMPVLLTYDMWKDGDRPEGLDGVQFKANCGFRDPDAPAYRKLPSPDAP